MFKTFKSVSLALQYIWNNGIECNIQDIELDLIKSGLIKINGLIICIDPHNILG